MGKKTWQEKLTENKGLPRVEKLTGKLAEKWGQGTMVIPAPLEVDELMRQVPRGRLTTIKQLREKLAQKHGTTIACPLTTGIFAWLAAQAAEEQCTQGKSREEITPWWRTLKSDGLLNPKFPGGGQLQKQLLEEEGFTVVPRGKNNSGVADYQKYI